MAEYDAIAEQYKRSKQAVWRHYIEQYSLFRLTGDLTGKSVLDLACGEGHYTRLVKALGASRVAGVDISFGMIDLARTAEEAEPRGIEYVLADAREVHFSETFDVVIAAYLLNYARTEAELEQMARAIARNLKPGGRFVSVNNNPAQSPAFFEASRKYGFTKSCPCEPVNGSPITYTFYLDEGTFQVENYHLDAAAHVRAFENAGFLDFAWEPMALSPAALPEQEHWDAFFADPPVVMLHCRKAAARTGASFY